MGAQTYDTGLALPQRTTIRNAVIARLAALKTTATPARYVFDVKPLARRFRGEGDEDGMNLLIETFQGSAPAIAVALGRKVYEATDGDAYLSRATLELAVYAVSKHSRGTVEGRLATDVTGDASVTADPGLEAMLEHIEELLLGQAIGVDGVSELRPVSEDEVITAADGSIWEQVYELHVERQINPSRANTTLITSIEGDHRLDGIADTNPNSNADLNPLVTTVTDLPVEP